MYRTKYASSVGCGGAGLGFPTSRACARRQTGCVKLYSIGSARFEQGRHCPDRFAGSGALGFEAASRHARVVMAELARLVPGCAAE